MLLHVVDFLSFYAVSSLKKSTCTQIVHTDEAHVARLPSLCTKIMYFYHSPSFLVRKKRVCWVYIFRNIHFIIDLFHENMLIHGA